MPLSASQTSLLLLSPPYRSLQDARVLFHSSGPDADYRGSTLVWRLTGTPSGQEFELALTRPPGVALMIKGLLAEVRLRRKWALGGVTELASSGATEARRLGLSIREQEFACCA